MKNRVTKIDLMHSINQLRHQLVEYCEDLICIDCSYRNLCHALDETFDILDENERRNESET